MTQAEAYVALYHLTYGWRETAASAGQLAPARRTIAMALLFGQGDVVGEEGPPPSAEFDATLVAAIAADVQAAQNALNQLAPSVPARVFVRATPIATRHDTAAIPPWAAGLQRASTLGPFADGLGCEWHVDTYDRNFQSHIGFARSLHTSPIVLIPDESAFRDQEIVELAGGTVWIAASQFNAPTQAGYVGLRISGGTLRLDGPIHGGGPFLLDPQTSITLELDLEPSPGLGAGGVTATLPAQATIHVSPGGVDGVETSPLSFTTGGATFALHRNDEPATYQQDLSAILVPYDATPSVLTAAASGLGGGMWTLAGRADIDAGAWTIPVTLAQESELREAVGIGGVALVLSPGFTASWGTLTGGNVRLGRAYVEVSPGLASFIAPAADNRRNSLPIRLWNERLAIPLAPGAAQAPRRCSIDVRYPRKHALKLFRSVSDGDEILSTATIAAHVDRPLHANGRRPGYVQPDAAIRWLRGTQAVRVQILQRTRPPMNLVAEPPTHVAPLILSNALLRTTPAGSLFAAGPLDQQGGIASGALVLLYGLYDIIPILPDPYAANIEPPPLPARGSPRTALLAEVRWTTPATPALTLGVVLPRAPQQQLVNLAPRPLQATPPRSEDQESVDIYGLFSRASGARPLEEIRLLDVSGNADQLGVTIALRRSRTEPAAEIAIKDLDLHSPGSNLRVFMLPPVQWEPVITPIPEPDPTFPRTLYSVDDGGPALMAANTVHLTRIAPVPLVDEVLRALRSGETKGALLFALPFGIKAVATFPAHTAEGTTLAELRRIRPSFDTMAGARQVRLAATFATSTGQSIPGAAVQLTNASAGPGATRISVLDNSSMGGGFSTRHMFNATFSPNAVNAGVPISRIDLSGYGESGWSRWTNENPLLAAGITEVRFDVMAGRTAYEVVQEKSICWPSMAVFVRTITIERQGNARVRRFDSGWVEAAPGVFRLEGFDGVFHPGAIKGYYNITSIREVGALVTTASGAIFQPVSFNADMAVEHATAGFGSKSIDANGDPAFLVPVQDVVGYVQRQPSTIINHQQLAELFASQGPIGGHSDCEINVGLSGLRMRVTGAYAEPAGGNAFAVAARGMPAMPSGQWSFTRTDNANNGASDNEPQPVDRTLALPLIRQGPAALSAGANPYPYRFADPRDLLLAAPAFDYGILYANETYRLLFVRPRIEVDANHVGRKQLSFGVRPLLADPYALVSSSSVFPKGKHCISFPNMPTLDILPGDHLRCAPAAFTVEPLRVREQAKTSNWRMALEYADENGHLTDVTVTLDSTATPPSTLQMSPLNVVVDTGPFKGLMRVVGDLEVKSPAAFTNASVVLGSALAPLGEFMTILKNFGLPVAMGASIAGNDDKALIYKQTIHIDIEKLLEKLFPDPDSGPKDKKRIDTGAFKLGGVIDIGMFISLSGRTHAGVFCKLEGDIQQAIIGKVLYAGGFMGLEISFELDEKTENGQRVLVEESKIELIAAVIGSVGGVLIPHVLKGEATVKKGYLLEIDLDSGKIKPGVVLSMEVEAVILKGVIGVGFEWEGKALMTRHEDKIHIEANIVAAATVQLAIFLETTIEIEGTFEYEVDQKVVAGLLIAFGIIPI